MAGRFSKVMGWIKKHPYKTASIVIGAVTVGYGVYRFAPQAFTVIGSLFAGSGGSKSPPGRGSSGSEHFSQEASQPTTHRNEATSTYSNCQKSDTKDDFSPETGTSGTVQKPIQESANKTFNWSTSPLRQGRCQKHSDCNTIEKKLRGVYRIKDEEGCCKYIGKSNDMNRRCKEHASKGLFIKGEDYFETLPARKEASNDDLFLAEREQIKRHSPTLNKTMGGNGR